MDNDINVSDIIMDSGVDPFDEVVEIEPTTSAEGSDPFDEIDEGNNEPESKESEESESEEKSEEVEKSEDTESDGNDDKVSENDTKDIKEDGDDSSGKEEVLPELDKQIEDGSLEIKINDDTLTLKDLKNDYIGQKEISKRFTEYDVKSKQLEKDTTEINGYINEFASKLKDGDSIGAMAYFVNLQG